MSDDRAERALRAAMTDGELPPAPGPAAIRRRVRDRRIGVASVVTALVLVVTAVGFGLTGPRSADTLVAAPSEASSASPSVSGGAETPSGWRVEYYRDLRFSVPASWGYAFAPGSDWCADSIDGKPAEQHRAPYVALGEPTFVRTIGCPAQPASLLTEHAQIRPLGPAEDYASARGVRAESGWWTGYSLVGNQVLSAVSRDRSLVERVLDSAEVAKDPPCVPEPGPVNSRRTSAWSVGSAGVVDPITVCQYDLAEDETRALRAVTTLDQATSQRVIDAIAAAPIHRPQPCETPATYDLALILRVPANGAVHDVHVSAGLCADGRTPLGGFDDGTEGRLLTRAACAPLIIGPIVVQSGGAYVMDACG